MEIPQFQTSRRQFLALGGAALAVRAGAADETELQRKLAADRNRPQYHIVPPAYALNDPNGPLYWKGHYHMFYQYSPRGEGMPRGKQWYHVVSEDMVHWKNLGVALAPTPGGPDKDGCWTGSAVVHNGVPTLIYTGASFSGGTPGSGRGGVTPAAGRGQSQRFEHVMVAVAADPNDPDLRKWNKILENPVIAGPPEGMTTTGFRDPALWKDGDTWYMIIGSGVSGVGGMVLLYRSKDLRRWEYLHPLATAKPNPNAQGPGGQMWECPDFFHLGAKSVLMVAAGNHYLTGTYKDLKFEQEIEGRIDSGSAYAQKTMEDAHGRRIWWGWVTEGRGAPPDAGWASAISLPRVLTLRADGRLNIDPAPELTSLRAKRHSVRKLTVGESSPLLLSQLRGDCMEIVAEIDPGTAQQVGLRVRSTADGSEQTLIGYDRTDGTLFSDTTQSNKNPPAAPASGRGGPRGAPLKKGDLHLANREPLRLRIFLDASVIETFANSRAGIIDRVYPSSPEALGIGVFARGGSASVRSLEVWELKPISKDRLTSGALI